MPDRFCSGSYESGRIGRTRRTPKSKSTKCSPRSVGSHTVLLGYSFFVRKISCAFVSDNVVQQLVLYLGQVKEITGALKISHSYPIVSLDFFRSLETIRGESVNKSEFLSCFFANCHYYLLPPSSKDSVQASLHLLQNDNLARLFPIHEDGSTVKILSQGGSRGTAFIHYNGKLCRYAQSQNILILKSSHVHVPPFCLLCWCR